MRINNKKRSHFYPVMFFLSLIAAAVCFASYNSGTSTVIAKSVSAVTTPLQAGAVSIHGFFSGIGDHFASVSELQRENEALREENKMLEKDNQQTRILRKQNDDLYAYLELKRERSDFEFVNAKIIARTSSNYTSTFTIDKGSFHGVEKNMPIVASDKSVIGIVFSVEATSAKCLAVTSYDCSIGVYDDRTGNTGILSGDFSLFSENKCLITGLISETQVAVGDTIRTSGLGGTYPGNLVIGTVTEIIPDPDTYTLSAVVQPSESLLKTDNIMVITSFSKTYE